MTTLLRCKASILSGLIALLAACAEAQWQSQAYGKQDMFQHDRYTF